MGFYNLSQKKSEVGSRKPLIGHGILQPQNDAISSKFFPVFTKCKLATPDVIRCKPGENFARAIQTAHAARFSAGNIKMKKYKISSASP